MKIIINQADQEETEMVTEMKPVFVKTERLFVMYVETKVIWD